MRESESATHIIYGSTSGRNARCFFEIKNHKKMKMKILNCLAIALILLSACNKDKNINPDNVLPVNFKYRVKSINSIDSTYGRKFTYNADGTLSKISPFGMTLESESNLTYNAARQLIRYENSRSKIDFIYNADGTIKTQTNFNKIASTTTKAEYTYNASGLSTKTNYRLTGGSVWALDFVQNISNINANTLQISTVSYDSRYSVYTFDSNKNLIKVQYYAIDETAKPVIENEYIYTYDNKNNTELDLPYPLDELGIIDGYAARNKNNVTSVKTNYYNNGDLSGSDTDNFPCEYDINGYLTKRGLLKYTVERY